MDALQVVTVALAGGGIGGIIGYALRGGEVAVLTRKVGEMRGRLDGLSRTRERLDATIAELKQQLRMAQARQDAATVLVTGMGTVLRNYAGAMDAITEERARDA